MKPMRLNIQLFATINTIMTPAIGNGAVDFRPRAVVSQTQNNALNQTTFTIDMYANMVDVYGVVDAVQYDFIANINDNQKHFIGTYDTTYVSNGQNVYLGSHSITIDNNPNGSTPQIYYIIGGNRNIYVAGDTWQGWNYNETAKYYYTAPTIPRVSSVTSTANTTTNKKDFGVQVNFTISRYSNSFTHTLEFTSGGTTYTIGTGLATSGSYTFPLDLISNYPSSASPTITGTCKTYEGTSLIGSANTTVYLNVPSAYVPTCSLAIDDDNIITKTWGIWVKSRSILKGIITAEGVANSTISSYLSTFDGDSFNTNSFNKSVDASGSLTVTSTVTDSRGRTATDSEIINVVDYTVPTIVSASVKRCNIDGTLNTFGTYGKVVCEYAVSPCENHNAKSLKVSLGATTKTFSLDNYSGIYTATDLFENIETNTTYNFNFELADSFETIPQTATVIPSYVLISKRAGGKGITFGQVATEDGFHSYLESAFHNGLESNEIYENAKRIATKEYVDIKSDYSTTETIIGKWTNGKPIYRKVLTAKLPTVSGATQSIFPYTGIIDNVEKIWIDYGESRLEAGVQTLPPGWNMGGTDYLRLWTDTTSAAIRCRSTFTDQNANFIIVVEYTKTTD